MQPDSTPEFPGDDDVIVIHQQLSWTLLQKIGGAALVEGRDTVTLDEIVSWAPKATPAEIDEALTQLAAQGLIDWKPGTIGGAE